MTVWWFTKEHDTRVRLVLEWKVNLNLNEDKCKLCENTNLRGRRTLRIKPDPRKTSAMNVARLKNKEQSKEHFKLPTNVAVCSLLEQCGSVSLMPHQDSGKLS